MLMTFYVENNKQCHIKEAAQDMSSNTAGRPCFCIRSFYINERRIPDENIRDPVSCMQDASGSR